MSIIIAIIIATLISVSILLYLFKVYNLNFKSDTLDNKRDKMLSDPDFDPLFDIIKLKEENELLKKSINNMSNISDLSTHSYAVSGYFIMDEEDKKDEKKSIPYVKPIPPVRESKGSYVSSPNAMPPKYQNSNIYE